MTYTAVVFFSRKPGVSPAAFQEYFEKNQVPILKKTAGDAFPIKHTRIYLQRSEEGDCPADIIFGNQDDFTFDAIALLEFEDASAGKRFTDATHKPEYLDRFDDVPLLPDRSKRRAALVNKVYETRRTD
ncbi:hypothetical protein OIDMADRAFT_60927 [Oidiodendron maius Zn]|uniref:EthD domain-containing protein n=1 Tax=Oidiodendron maius (strain Zn) TaxID=913774 RepID=A0A0C3GD69_OIDMZ|nr:hypothetical protein OIDMADRAFT_60927 [Oidiodendron maius Zn]